MINCENFFTINLMEYRNMNIKVKLLPIAVMATLSTNLFAETSDIPIDLLPKDSKIVNIEKGTVGNNTITFVKYISGKDNQIIEKIFDSNMEELSKESLKHPIANKIGSSLQTLMLENEANTSALFTVRITLNSSEKFEIEQIPMTGSLSLYNGSFQEDADTLSAYDKQRKSYDIAYSKYLKSKYESIKEIAQIVTEQSEWKNSNHFVNTTPEGGDFLVANLTKNQIDALLEKNDKHILSIEFHSEVIDATAGAMLNSRVDPYALVFGNTNGSGVGVFLSEATSCPDPGFITNYQRLSGVDGDVVE